MILYMNIQDLCIYIYVSIKMYICIYMYVYIHTCIYICMYAYICTYTNIYVCIYLHTSEMARAGSVGHTAEYVLKLTYLHSSSALVCLV